MTPLANNSHRFNEIIDWSLIIKLCVCFFFRAALDCLWTDIFKMSPDRIEQTEFKRRVSVTIIWFILTLALAVFIPNIGVVIQILGAFAAIFIFIFPGTCIATYLASTTGMKLFSNMACVFCTSIS